jgi:hypothetical protein
MARIAISEVTIRIDVMDSSDTKFLVQNEKIKATVSADNKAPVSKRAKTNRMNDIIREVKLASLCGSARQDV